MILGSYRHTAGDIRRWTVRYHKWLDNAADIVTAVVTSSSTTCTVDMSTVLGKDVQFFLHDGIAGETLMVTIKITDSFANVKTDTVAFVVVAP